MKNLLLGLIACIFWGYNALAQQREPIIDVHLHCYDRWPAAGHDTTWYPPQFKQPANTEALRQQSLKALSDYNIVRAVTSGSVTNLQAYREAAGERIMAGYELSAAPTDALIAQLRQRIEAGNLKVFAELSVQYSGISPADTIMDKFYRLAV
jgi:uncharacterized protein